MPYAELEPSLAAAYKRIGSQVAIPGFRKGKVPPRLIDQRFGRAVVLEEAVNDALPRFYGQAVEENSVAVLGQPEVDVTEVPDPQAGGDLRFTAEVDVRPEIELPDYSGLQVTVDDAEVTDGDVDEQLQGLRERFGVLRGVDRPAEDGDFVSIDLAATVDGEELADASAKGLSYEIGSGSLLEGIDAALVGRTEGETATFSTALVGGNYAGRDADVQVAVRSVKERELPDLDDDFAQTASEFDTVEELREDTRARLERVRRMEQGAAARDRVLETLLERVEVPLPEGLVRAEVDGRLHSLDHQLEAAGLSREDFLAEEGRSAEDFDAEVETRARESIAAQFVLDAIARAEQLEVTEEELTQHLLRRAMRLQVSPEELVQQVVQAGQVPQLVAEVVRAKALAVVMERAAVVDASGRPVDLSELATPASPPDEAESEGDPETEPGTDVEAAAEVDEERSAGA